MNEEILHLTIKIRENHKWIKKTYELKKGSQFMLKSETYVVDAELGNRCKFIRHEFVYKNKWFKRLHLPHLCCFGEWWQIYEFLG